MEDNTKEIEKFQRIIDNFPADSTAVKVAKEKLAQIQERKKVEVDKDFSGVVTSINTLIDKVYNTSANISSRDIDNAINERLKKMKINENNLSPELKKLIGETKTIEVKVNNVKTFGGKTGADRRLIDVLLSDYEAQNNVYLYGEAGTGKTYIAGIIADRINYKLITLNCNQYTSPLDILGGQTIDGYQEGRLTEAWGNIELGLNAKNEPYDGALLLLDELPKIDPNTAGLLNDGLAKIKDAVKVVELANKTTIEVQPTISNGRGQRIPRAKIFIIATGNSLLNEANKDYEANFKQDLSLQDRFAGSCYKITYNYKFEYDKIMTKISSESFPNGTVIDMTFAFNFLAQLRQQIVEDKLTGIAFVSTRLMIVARDTFVAFLVNREENPNKIPRPKKLSEVVKSFLSLFSEQQRESLIQKLDSQFKEFYAICDVKDVTPLDQLGTSTELERKTAELIIEEAERKYAENSAIPL
jgi:adenylate kinase family enzyme